MAVSPSETSNGIGEVETVCDPLTTLSHMLDVPVEDVVDAVEALLVFNDQNTAQIIRGELDQRDARAEIHSMVRALLSDIEAVRGMIALGTDQADMLLILAVLRDRIMVRGGA